jgi:hypothetical protein
MSESETSSKPKSATWSTIGLAAAFVALAFAVLSPWIIDAIVPKEDRKPIDEVAVEVATRIKDRLVAKAKGEEFVVKPAAETSTDLGKWVPPATIGIGLLGVCLGVVGFTRHESARMSASAVAVGLAAIVFQYFLLMAAAIILILLIGFILSALGIDLPTP